MADKNPEADKDTLREDILGNLNKRYRFVKKDEGGYQLESTDDSEYPYLDSLLLAYLLSGDEPQSPPQILKVSISRRIDSRKLVGLIQRVLEDTNPVNYSLNDLKMELVDNNEQHKGRLEYLIGEMSTTDWDYSWYPPKKHQGLEELINEAGKRRGAVFEKLGINDFKEFQNL